MSAPQEPRESPWYVQAFGPWYTTVYAHRDEQSAEREVQAITRWVPWRSGERVLDLSCGNGRHVRALRKLGFAVAGMDLSPTLLQEARAREDDCYVQADQRHVPFRDACFAGVVSLFTSFGYFESDAENAAVIGEAARVLQITGTFVLDVPNPRCFPQTLVPRSSDQRNGHRIDAERRWDGRRIVKDVVITAPTGEVVGRYQESVRVYAPTELAAMAHRHGLEPRQWFGSFAGATPDEGDRLILIAEKVA